MKSLHHRVARLLEEVRRRQVDQGERITKVIVHCPDGRFGDPKLGVERLVLAGVGRQPSLYEVTELALEDDL